MNVSKNVPFLKSVVLTLVCLVCFAICGYAVVATGDSFTVTVEDNHGMSINYDSGNKRFEITGQGWGEGKRGEGKISITHTSPTISSVEEKVPISWGDWNNNSVKLLFSVSNGDASSKIDGSLRSTIYLYLAIDSDGKLYYSSSTINLGPVLSSTSISSSAYCNGSATIDIDYEIDNALGGEKIKLYKGTDFVSDMSTKSIDITEQGEYHFELWYNGNCVDKSEPIKVEAKAPMLDAIASKTNILRNVNEVIDPTIQVTPNLQTCDVDKTINVSLSDNTNYVYDAGTKKLTFKGTEPGTYPLTMTFTHGSLTKEVTISSSVVEYPACYNLLKEDDTPIEVCTDANGDLIIDLDSEPYNTITGSIIVPENYMLQCRNFKIYGVSDNYSNFQFINKGTISCEGICSIGIDGKTLGNNNSTGKALFLNESKGSIIANKIDVKYRYNIPSFEGIWSSNTSIIITNGQGQDLTFLDNCTVQANELKIDCNISENVIIQGDLVVDNIESSKKICVESNGEVTVGDITKIPWAATVIIKDGGTLNLCGNPTSGADDLGFVVGTVLYNREAWVDTNPFEEGDINNSSNSESWKWSGLGGNSDWSPKRIIAAYANYDDCMNKKAIPGVLLGYDDDPFLPKDKEIYQLYNCNPCSKDFEDAKMEIREIHGKTFRLINGELIYCENDN